MTAKYETGFIYGWNGGDCPVHPETEVRAWRRGLGLPICWKARDISWRHDYGDADIIAFQVVKQYVEPKVIWVNEYGRFGSVWQSEQEARDGAAQVEEDATRIAVKYQEVKE
jgi:hypothetical protein